MSAVANVDPIITTDVQVDPSDHLVLFEQGNRLFSKMFTYWMDTNSWSHPTMVALARGCLNGRSWLHSSQIAGLRHCTLHAPGPRTFVAIERLNFFLHRYLTTKLLIPGTGNSNAYAGGFAITENGEPPPLGWWVEVFVGQRRPTCLDLDQHLFTEAQAVDLSERWGAMVRKLFIKQGLDLITELEKTVWHKYPVKEPDRVNKLFEVILNKSAWSTDELTRELPAIATFTANLGGPADAETLIQQLRA